MSSKLHIGGVMLVVLLGLMVSSGTSWVSAEDPREGVVDVQERGLPKVVGPASKSQPTAVDLVPVELHGDTCVINASKQVVTIVNVGSAAAQSTVLDIRWSTPNGIVNVQENVPPLPALTAVHIPLVLPTGCPTTIDCSFTLRVDAANQITEAGGPVPTLAEQNNRLSGYCYKE
jgi:hypothetical protein